MLIMLTSESKLKKFDRSCLQNEPQGLLSHWQQAHQNLSRFTSKKKTYLYLAIYLFNMPLFSPVDASQLIIFMMGISLHDSGVFHAMTVHSRASLHDKIGDNQVRNGSASIMIRNLILKHNVNHRD